MVTRALPRSQHALRPGVEILAAFAKSYPARERSYAVYRDRVVEHTRVRISPMFATARRARQEFAALMTAPDLAELADVLAAIAGNGWDESADELLATARAVHQPAS